MPEVSEFSVLPYIQNQKIGNLGKCFLTLKFDSCCNLSSETAKMNWVKNLKVKKWIKKKEIKFPRFPSFRFCSIPKIENLEISESVALLQILKVVATFSKFVFSSERVSEAFFFFLRLLISRLSWKLYWNSSSCSEDTEILPFNIYFH